LKHLKGDFEKIGDEEAYEEIPLGRVIAEELEQLAANNPWGNDFVFYGYRRDRPISKSEVEQAFNDAVYRIVIAEEDRRRRKLTFHSWRHWYNTMTRGKVSDYLLRRITRHKSAEMTERYTARLTGEQRRVVAELAEALI
jgi:integrase